MAQDSALAQLEGGTKIDIQCCYSCRGRHVGRSCTPYSQAHPPFTHWYTCPTTGDPVPLSIILFEGNPTEVNNRILADVSRAQANGGRMIFATFRIDGSGGVEVTRHCQNFPTARFREAVAVLWKDLEKEAPLPEPAEPLPRADIAKLFSRPKLNNHPPVETPPAAHAALEARNGAGRPDGDEEEDEAEEEDDE